LFYFDNLKRKYCGIFVLLSSFTIS